MSKRCTVCNHPMRGLINQDLLNGVPYRKLAAQYNLSPAALSRHTRHLARNLENGHRNQDQQFKREILDKLDLLDVRLNRIFQAATDAQSLRLALDCIRESIRVLNLTEKFRARLFDQ
jgi:hypothetical protein